MTDTINTVLAAALEVLPMLSDENDNYCIKSTDTAEVVSGKIYDAFNYGLDDTQYNALVDSARKSTDRAKALAAIKDWSDAVADNFEAELDPADMGEHSALFEDFPSLDEASDDDDVLTVGYALTKWPVGVPFPKQIAQELEDAKILPNVEEQLANIFTEDTKPARSRRQRRNPEPELSETDKELAALADISDLLGGDAADDADAADDHESAQREAEAAAQAKKDAAEAKAVAKAEAEAEAKEKAKKEAEEKAKAQAEAKAKKEAAAKAKKEAEAKAAAEEKARKRSVRTTSISANPYGVVGTMRRILLLDKEIRFDEVALIMADLGVDAKKGTWSPKLSDLRGAYEFFESMGLIDHDRLDRYKTVADLAEVDDAMDAEYTARLTQAVDKHVKSKK